MPLLLSKEISPYSAYSVWNIQETNDRLWQLISEPVPQNLHPTRLAEWMVGRILVKNLCVKFGVPYQGIEPLESGKPALKNSKVQISISHSFPMATAMIHLNKSCGIDLERPRQKLFATRDKFLNGKEKQYADNLNQLCVVWCGKEVLYKIHGECRLSLKDDTTIEIESADRLKGYIHRPGLEAEYRIHYETVKDYFIAYSL